MRRRKQIGIGVVVVVVVVVVVQLGATQWWRRMTQQSGSVWLILVYDDVGVCDVWQALAS